MAKGQCSQSAHAVSVLHVLFQFPLKTIISTSDSIRELKRGNRIRTMATLITRLSKWRDEKEVLSIELTEDSHPRTSTQINPKFESATIIYFAESVADVLAHKAEIDAGHTARKTAPLPKDAEDSSADEAIFSPSKRTRRRPSPGTSDDDRSFDDMFAELSRSYSENDHDGQPMVSPIEAIEGRGDHSLRDANAFEVGQLRIELNEYKLKCQQLQKDVKNKEIEETRLKKEVKRISDLLYMDPAQQLAALVIHFNGCLEELKTALADSRRHSQDLQQLLDRQQQSDSLPGNSGTRRVDAKQYLVSGMSLMINEADLKLAVSYGSVGNGDPNMRSMINKIMESVYTREFMATHSYTGKKAPAKRQDKEHQPKPALPIDDVKAIRLFVTSYWSRKHKVTLNPKLITMAIQDKLGTEHREYRRIGRMLQNQTASYNAQEQDNELDEGH